MPTQWRVRSSAVYDALCLLNIWTGDPFYTDSHPGVYERWLARLPDPVIEAFKRLAYVIREQEKGIISAKLCSYFSAIHPLTLNDLIEAIRQPEVLQTALKKTPYYEAHEWLTFEHLRNDLLVLLEFLDSQLRG